MIAVLLALLACLDFTVGQNPQLKYPWRGSITVQSVSGDRVRIHVNRSKFAGRAPDTMLVTAKTLADDDPAASIRAALRPGRTLTVFGFKGRESHVLDAYVLYVSIPGGHRVL